MTPRAKKWTKRIAITVGTLAVLFFGLIGLAHTSFGRPILMWLSGAGVTGGCPLGFDQANPAATEKFRKEQLAKREGKDAAKAHRALDFELGKTTRADVNAWVIERKATCAPERQGAALKCTSYAQTVGAAVTDNDLFLLFGEGDKLVALDLMRPPVLAQQAAEVFNAQVDAVSTAVGPATKQHGEGDPTWLEAEIMRQASRDFRYRDYVATITATNLGKRGVRVREQYQWANDVTAAQAD